MDTPTIAAYYREQEPLKRKALLEQSIEAGECPEENEIRKELWELRYADSSKAKEASRADGFLALWMTLEFNRQASKRLFGIRSAQKEIRRQMEKLKFQEFQQKGGLYEEMLYRECCHLVHLYIELCKTDRSYNSTLLGIINMSADRALQKRKADIREVAEQLPVNLGMEKELKTLTRAAREIYKNQFPEEAGI